MRIRSLGRISVPSLDLPIQDCALGKLGCDSRATDEPGGLSARDPPQGVSFDWSTCRLGTQPRRCSLLSAAGRSAGPLFPLHQANIRSRVQTIVFASLGSISVSQYSFRIPSYLYLSKHFIQFILFCSSRPTSACSHFRLWTPLAPWAGRLQMSQPGVFKGWPHWPSAASPLTSIVMPNKYLLTNWRPISP